MPNLTDEQFERLIATLRPPVDPEIERRKAAEAAAVLEDRRIAGARALQEEQQKAAIKAKCNHKQGSSFESDKLGKNHLTQGRSPDSALVLHKGSRWPADLSDSFIICQHCTMTIMPGSPDWDAAFEVCA